MRPCGERERWPKRKSQTERSVVKEDNLGNQRMAQDKKWMKALAKSRWTAPNPPQQLSRDRRESPPAPEKRPKVLAPKKKGERSETRNGWPNNRPNTRGSRDWSDSDRAGHHHGQAEEGKTTRAEQIMKNIVSKSQKAKFSSYDFILWPGITEKYQKVFPVSLMMPLLPPPPTLTSIGA